MIALATPFGSCIEQGVRATTEGLFDTSKNAVNSAFDCCTKLNEIVIDATDFDFSYMLSGSSVTSIK